MSKQIYVWEIPVRMTHWINAAAVALLALTGFYIGNPFIYASSTDQYIMGWMRFIHFVSAYFLIASILVRLYWAFAGNQYANWRVFNPFSAVKFKELIEISKFYLFIGKEPPKGMGHTACATYVYLGLFAMFIAEIITGFALYSQSHFGMFWNLMGGWLLSVMSVQAVRLLHHLFMWGFIAFAIAHVYIGWFLNRAEKNGLMTSIFTGYKTVDE